MNKGEVRLAKWGRFKSKVALLPSIADAVQSGLEDRLSSAKFRARTSHAGISWVEDRSPRQISVGQVLGCPCFNDPTLLLYHPKFLASSTQTLPIGIPCVSSTAISWNHQKTIGLLQKHGSNDVPQNFDNRIALLIIVLGIPHKSLGCKNLIWTKSPLFDTLQPRRQPVLPRLRLPDRLSEELFSGRGSTFDPMPFEMSTNESLTTPGSIDSRPTGYHDREFWPAQSIGLWSSEDNTGAPLQHNRFHFVLETFKPALSYKWKTTVSSRDSILWKCMTKASATLLGPRNRDGIGLKNPISAPGTAILQTRSFPLTLTPKHQ